MDGSALDNPGPCGAAAVLYPDGIERHPTVHKEAISRCSTSFHEELEAIRLALQQSLLYADSHQFCEVFILSDCQSAIQTVCSSGTEDNNHLHTSLTCKKLASHLQGRGITTRIAWICGHAGLLPNEIADEAAKAAAHSAI